MRILVVEDDANLAELLGQVLQQHHYLVEVATDGQTGWEMAQAFPYDLIVLDVMLPRLNGLQFCQQLRTYAPTSFPSPNQHTPVLLLTAADASLSKVAGLDAGADDYVVKPFDLYELLARVRALLRRQGKRSPILEWDGLRLDPSNCVVTYQQQPIHLSAKEYILLELLLRHPQRIFSYSALIEQLWAADDIPTENAVRAHIKGLRKRLKEAGANDHIETIYGLGYRLKASSSLPST